MGRKRRRRRAKKKKKMTDEGEGEIGYSGLIDLFYIYKKLIKVFRADVANFNWTAYIFFLFYLITL